jgi:hypothetical protein
MLNATTHPNTIPPANTTGSGPGATVQALLRRVVLLATGYAAISLASVAAIVLHRIDHVATGPSVWTHGIIVAATALMALSGAILASRGNRGAFLRLRIGSAVLVIAVLVIVALPGSFPLWMKLSEALGAALMAAIAVTVNGRTLRSEFTPR